MTVQLSPSAATVVSAAFEGLSDNKARALHRLLAGGEIDEPSASEADFHLCCLLGQFTRDPVLIEEIWQASAIAALPGRDAKTQHSRPTTIQRALARSQAEWRRRQTTATAAPDRTTLPVYSDLAILKLPDPAWLIDGLLPAGGLVEVVGRYGAGKTFLFLDWLMHIAAGMSWQGRKVTRGPCLYVYGEGSMKPRVAAWRAAHHIPPADAVGVGFVPGTVNLLDDAAVTAFLDQIKAKPAVIALDTLSRMAPGDENSPEHGALVVAACDRIQRATGAAVLLGHHTPWDPDRQRPKGSSKVPDCADAVFLLDNEDGALRLTCQKMRDAETPTPLHLKLIPQDAALVVAKGQPKLTDLEHLCGIIRDEGPLTKAELQLRLGKSKRAVERLIQEAGTTRVITILNTDRQQPARYAAPPPLKGVDGGAGTPATPRQDELARRQDQAAEGDLPF